MVARVIRFFTESWALKLAAAGLAILLWMAVRAGEPERARIPGIPVEVNLLDPDWQLAGPPEPATVSITVQGPTGELLTLAAEPPRIVFPVERVSDTLESQVVALQWIQLPAGIREARVLTLQPDTIRLRYERLATATLPVQIRITGALPEGFRLSRPLRANPEVLMVRAPRDHLARLDSVPLLPVDVTGLRSTTNVPTRVDTAAVPGVTVTPSEVNVILRVIPDSLADPADSARRRPPF